MRGRRTIAVLGLIVLATLEACVATESAAPARGVVVRAPPPAPIAEAEQPAAPSPSAVWVAGYWHWTGMQYTWIPGHWENAPPGKAWTPPRYLSANGAYYYEAGTWRAVAPGSQRPNANSNAIR